MYGVICAVMTLLTTRRRRELNVYIELEPFPLRVLPFTPHMRV